MIIIVFSLIGIFLFMFLLCTALYPELVGIGGKKAKQIEESHKNTTETKTESSPPTL